MAVSNSTSSPRIQRITKPFFEDEYAHIVLDDSIPAVVVTLRGIPKSSEHYQMVQLKRMELMNREIKNYPKLHMLTDSRTAGPVLDDDVNYFKTLILPQMEQAGIRHLAIVMPSNKFTQFSIKEMTSEVRLIQVRFFASMRDARFWLKKMTLA